MEAEKRAQRLLDRACGEVKAFAAGWDRDRLTERIQEIAVICRPEQFVSLDRRRRIARFARCLHKEIELAGIGIGNVEQEAVFLAHLHLLETFDGILRLPVREAPQSQSKRGGARRSGWQSFKGWVLGKIVRLYCGAQADAGFSAEGPLVRFANAVGELALGTAKPFTSNAVKAEFRRIKLRAARPNG